MITEEMLATPDLDLKSRLILEAALSKFGDESLIPSLDLLALKGSTISRLDTSRTILRIIIRSESSIRREKTSGDGNGPMTQ